MFNIALFMDWQFVSGCFPPRLSTTQLPSTRTPRVLSGEDFTPRLVSLSGARKAALLRDRRGTAGNFLLLITQSRPSSLEFPPFRALVHAL